MRYPMKVYGYDIQGNVSTIIYHLDQNKMNKEVIKQVMKEWKKNEAKQLWKHVEKLIENPLAEGDTYINYVCNTDLFTYVIFLWVNLSIYLFK